MNFKIQLVTLFFKTYKNQFQNYIKIITLSLENSNKYDRRKMEE